MKKTGNISECSAERDAAILLAYREEVKTCRVRSVDAIARRIVRRPCRRFWVSEERAITVVSKMLRGIPCLDAMLPSKRRMYTEIHRRVVEMRALRPRARLCHLVSEIINQPAPEFYMSARYARDIIMTQL